MKKLLRSAMCLTVLSMGLKGLLFAQDNSVLASAKQSYNGIKQLVVKGRFCDVYLSATEGKNKVDFQGEITGKTKMIGNVQNTIQIRQEQRGDVLEVWVEGEFVASGIGWNNINGKLLFDLPQDIVVRVDNSSGDVRLRGLKSNQKCELETSSGDIVAESVEANLRVVASSGDIEINDLIGDLDVRTSSGDQNVRNVKGNLYCVASSGDVGMDRIEGTLNVTASSGDLSLDDVKGNITLRTSSGDITGRAVVLTSEAQIDTTSGEVRLSFKNMMNDLSFDLKTSSGNLRVGKESGGKRYLLKQGAVNVRGISTSGDQTYHAE